MRVAIKRRLLGPSFHSDASTLAYSIGVIPARAPRQTPGFGSRRAKNPPSFLPVQASASGFLARARINTLTLPSPAKERARGRTRAGMTQSNDPATKSLSLCSQGS